MFTSSRRAQPLWLVLALSTAVSVSARADEPPVAVSAAADDTKDDDDDRDVAPVNDDDPGASAVPVPVPVPAVAVVTLSLLASSLFVVGHIPLRTVDLGTWFAVGSYTFPISVWLDGISLVMGNVASILVALIGAFRWGTRTRSAASSASSCCCTWWLSGPRRCSSPAAST